MLEQKKLKAELLRIQAAKAEMEYIVAQRLEDIKRLEDNIKKQEDAENQILEKLKGAK